jgi:transposase
MAEQILSEIGTNIKRRFPNAAHMCSWAGFISEHKKMTEKGNHLKRKKETNI